LGCATCPKCGDGKPGIGKSDPVKYALCKILCEIETEVCEGKTKREDRDKEAKKRAQNSPDVKKAIEKKHGKGSTGSYGKQRNIPMKKPPPGDWGRHRVQGAELDAMKRNMREKLTQAGKEILTDKAKQKLKRAWLKFIPIVNVISTALDVVDVISTAADIYKMVDEAMKVFNDPVFKTFPDVTVDGPGGQLKDIYDFKFSGDKWQKGQKELYDQALEDAKANGKAVEISPDECLCDILKTGSGAASS
jgi:hypothetical protein